SLRNSAPATLGGKPVKKAVDYWDEKLFGPFVSETDKLPRNVIQYFTDGFVITVRPSGTEPKLKFYCQILPEGKSDAKGVELLREARKRADQVTNLIYNELLARIDVSLSEAALCLPDIVDLERKRDFEQKTVPKLREGWEASTWSTLQDVLGWLRSETQAMTPGADPLPAIKVPVAKLCAGWSTVLTGKPLLKELENWSRPA
ncbi:MAG TPA: hypothetical protein VHH73_05400, partial [Verrucomicrobiae bacterium]|nr:hypothetical protein [Verrucomicrobiae bacterium]